MGSDSDLPVMAESAAVLEEMGIPFEVDVISAHRLPDRTTDYAKSAITRGLKVIIAGAGGAAHLAGVVAANTAIPVIAVPILGKSLAGLDSLLSMVQMPPGIPVATVGVNGARNAGILAAQIIGSSSREVSERVAAFKESLAAQVNQKSAKLKGLGYKKYLEEMGK